MPGKLVKSFFVPFKPAVKGNSKKIVRFGARFGARFGLIGDAKARAAEQSLVAHLLPLRPSEPWRGPVNLHVEFVLPVPASWPAWKREAAVEGRVWPTSKPDRGNMLKLLEDALEAAGFFANDSQIVTGLVTKVYGEVPGYCITLEQLVQATRESEKARA